MGSNEDYEIMQRIYEAEASATLHTVVRISMGSRRLSSSSSRQWNTNGAFVYPPPKPVAFHVGDHVFRRPKGAKERGRGGKVVLGITGINVHDAVMTRDQ